MFILHIICYAVTAITFAFPPLAPLFEVYKSTYCTFVPKIDSVPWNTEASLQVCKNTEILKDLFSKASPLDVCFKVEEKGLVVVSPAAPPALKPEFISGLFQPPFCPALPFFVCPLPAVSLPPPASPPSSSSKSFTSIVKDLFENLMVVLSEGLSFEGGFFYPSRPLMVVFVSITIKKLLSRGFGKERKRTCPVKCACSFCTK